MGFRRLVLKCPKFHDIRCKYFHNEVLLGKFELQLFNMNSVLSANLKNSVTLVVSFNMLNFETREIISR